MKNINKLSIIFSILCVSHLIYTFLHFIFGIEIPIISQLFGMDDTSHQHAVIVDTIMGLVNEGKAKKLEKSAKRPNYEIPQEIFQNQAMFESMANSSRIPGQAIMEENIAKSTANAIGQAQRGAASSVDALSAIGGIQQNQNDVFSNLGIAGAQMQMANKDKLAQARESTADYRQQAFDYNKNQPYLLKLKQSQKYRDQAQSQFNNISRDVHEFGSSVGGMAMGSM